MHAAAVAFVGGWRLCGWRTADGYGKGALPGSVAGTRMLTSIL